MTPILHLSKITTIPDIVKQSTIKILDDAFSTWFLRWVYFRYFKKNDKNYARSVTKIMYNFIVTKVSSSLNPDLFTFI